MKEYRIVDEYFAVLMLCDRIQGRSVLHKKLSQTYRESAINEAIQGLLDRGLLIAEGNRLLSLIVADKPRGTEHLERIILS